jgi:hypothetical protein
MTKKRVVKPDFHSTQSDSDCIGCPAGIYRGGNSDYNVNQKHGITAVSRLKYAYRALFDRQGTCR